VTTRAGGDHVLATAELRLLNPDRATFAARRRNKVTVVLDGVTGPYNIGAIFRLCDAFLVERLVTCGSVGAVGAVVRRDRCCGIWPRGEICRRLSRGCRTHCRKREPGGRESLVTAERVRSRLPSQTAAA
jgi:hypothetical protein